MPFNPRYKIHKKQPEKSLKYYLDGLNQSNRFILSECITLVESTNPDKRDLGYRILSQLQTSESSIRIGLTGSPGVGKSTLLDCLGMKLIEKGHKVAILAIDPSSTTSRGSILGDKTRMEKLSIDQSAYIRPTASGTYLGGVSANTREAIALVEAAGYDVIIIETVGVGQSETLVSSLVDAFILMILPGAGDDIQGIKRGIMEMADILFINKADDERKNLAKVSKKQLINALSLMQNKVVGWNPKVMIGSGLNNIGVDELIQSIIQFIDHSKNNGYFHSNRNEQKLMWYDEQYKNIILNEWITNSDIYNKAVSLREKLMAGQINPIDAIVETRRLILREGIK